MTESIRPKRQDAVSAPLDADAYTHITVTYSEPLEPDRGVRGTVTIELDEPMRLDEIGENGFIRADNVWDVFKAIDQAFVDAGRPSTIKHYAVGDVFIIAWLNLSGVIRADHTYIQDGFAYLSEVDWVSSWELRRGA